MLISPEPVCKPTVNIVELLAVPLLATAVYTPDENLSRSIVCFPLPSGPILIGIVSPTGLSEGSTIKSEMVSDGCPLMII